MSETDFYKVFNYSATDIFHLRFMTEKAALRDLDT